MTSSQVLSLPPPSAISRTVQTQGQKGKVRTHADPLSSAISVLCVHNVTPAGVGQNFVVTVPRNSIPTHPPEYYDLLKHLLYHQYCVFAKANRCELRDLLGCTVYNHIFAHGGNAEIKIHKI